MENVYIIAFLFVMLSIIAYYSNNSEKIEPEVEENPTVETKEEIHQCKNECSSKCKKNCDSKIKECITSSSIEEKVGKKNVNKHNTRKKSS